MDGNYLKQKGEDMPWKAHTIARSMAAIFGVFLAAWMLAACAPWHRSHDIAPNSDLTKASAIPGLQKALKDNAPNVRMEAAMALGEIGPNAREALPDLVAVLGDPMYKVREAAANAMERIIGTASGSEADKGLMVLVHINRLESEDWTARVNAASQLAQMGPAGADAIPALTSALLDEREWSYYWTQRYNEVRRAAAKAIGEMRFAARSARPALIKASKFQDPGVRLEAVSALGKIGTRSDSAIIEALKDSLKDDDGDVRRETANALGAFEVYADGNVPNLVKALSDKNVDARREAAQILDRFGPKTDSAADALIAALDDTDKEVRQTAARTIARFGIGNQTVTVAPLTLPVVRPASEKAAAPMAITQPATKIRSTVNILNMRAMPGISSQCVGRLLQNETATVVETLTDWLKIRKADGTDGYVFKAYTVTVLGTEDGASDFPATETDAIQSAARIRSTVDGLNIRAIPDLKGRRTGKLFHNETAVVLDTQGDWLKIRKSDGTAGYVFGEYTAAVPETGDASSVPKPESQAAHVTASMPVSPVAVVPAPTVPAVPRLRPNVDVLVIRNKPYGNEQIGQLMRNEEAEVVEAMAGWVKIKKADGTTGYVFEEYTEVSSETGTTAHSGS
ncbi:MAG: HEAT repeat domain-containing protein [Thermodesulfobacteriota bacterium]